MATPSVASASDLGTLVARLEKKLDGMTVDPRGLDESGGRLSPEMAIWLGNDLTALRAQAAEQQRLQADNVRLRKAGRALVAIVDPLSPLKSHDEILVTLDEMHQTLAGTGDVLTAEERESVHWWTSCAEDGLAREGLTDLETRLLGIILRLAPPPRDTDRPTKGDDDGSR